MGLCGKTLLAVTILLVALLVHFFSDIRDPLAKADSILFVKQEFDHRFDIEDQGRWCFFDVPNENEKGTQSPILFVIHGKSMNADDMKTLFGETAVARARREGFLVVYPVGLMHDGSRTWNAGSVSSHNDADDVAYFSQVVAHLAKNFNADPESVFLSGMSNGGFMTHRLACAWASESQPIRVRAIAPTLGGLGKMKYDAKCGGEAIKIGLVPIPSIRLFDQEACPYQAWIDAPSHFECDALKDLPALIVNNGADILVPPSGSVSGQHNELYPPVEYTLRFYAEANGCDYPERVESFRRVSSVDPDDITTCHSLRGCRANTTLCVSHKSGHNWVARTNGDEPAMPSRFFLWLMSPYAKTIDTSSEILGFFSHHRKH